LNTGNKTFKIALLFRGEIARHRKASSGLRKSKRRSEGEYISQR
jgi:hypothetical protein